MAIGMYLTMCNAVWSIASSKPDCLLDLAKPGIHILRLAMLTSGMLSNMQNCQNYLLSWRWASRYTGWVCTSKHTNCSGVYGSRSVKHKALRAQMQFFANSSKKKRYERLAKLAPWTAGTMRLLWCPLCFASFPDALALVMMRFFRFVTPLW